MENRRFPDCKFTIKEEKEICEKYTNGRSAYSLSKEYGASVGTITRILRTYEIPQRTLSQARNNFLKRTLNEDSFENIDSPEKAYWLGVMYSDGYINKTEKYTNFFGLSISTKDREWLEKFKKFLNYNGNINDYFVSGGYKTGTPYSRLLIGSNKIVEDLEKLGVVEHKTKLIQRLPNISFLDDFIRGYIDGDGSLRKNCPNIRICGNYNFLLEVGEYFKIPYKIYPDKSIFDISYRAKQSRYLEKRLYKNATVFLDRKYNIAKRSFDSPLTLEDVMENSLN